VTVCRLPEHRAQIEAAIGEQGLLLSHAPNPFFNGA
jgi:hypothetical protein